MLPSRIVKAALLIPVRFVLVCLSAVIVASAIYVLVQLGIAFDPSTPPRTAMLPLAIFSAFRTVFVCSAVIAVVIVLFHVLTLKRFRAFSLFILYITALAALLGGIRGIEALDAGKPRFPVAPVLDAGAIYTFGGDGFYAEHRDGVVMSPVVRYDQSSAPKGFSIHPEAVEDPYGGTIRITDTGTEYSLLDSASTAVRMFAPRTAMAAFFREVGALNDVFFSPSMASGVHSKEFLIPFVTLLTFLLCIVGSWFLVRLTRWPLFNFVLVLAVVRLLFFLFSFLQSKGFSDIASIVLKDQYLAYVPAAAFLFLGLVFLIITALLPPFEEWRREVAT